MAIHRATGLRRNADRLPPLAGHEYGLRRSWRRQLFFVWWQREQISQRTIRRGKSLLYLWKRNSRLFRKPLPQRRRKIRDLHHVKFSFRVQRVINLRSAVCRLAHRRAERLQFFLWFAQQFRHHRSVGSEDNFLALILTRGTHSLRCSYVAKWAIINSLAIPASGGLLCRPLYGRA